MISGKFLAFFMLASIGLVYSSSLNKELINELEDTLVIQETLSELETKFNGLSPCTACYAAIPLIKELIIKNDTKGFREIAVLVCVTLKLANDPQVCNQAIELFEPAVLNVIKDTALSDIEICSAFINCGPIKNPAFTWNITLPNVPKPPIRPLNPPNVNKINVFY